MSAITIQHLPTDVLRLILPLIPDPKGYYGLVCSCKLFAKLGREIMESMKNKYTTIQERVDEAGTISESKLPNGILHGPTTYYGSDNRFVETYKDGKKEGPYQVWCNEVKIMETAYRDNKPDGLTHSWYSFGLPRRLSGRSLYDKGRTLFAEYWYYDGNLQSRYIYEGGFWGGSKQTNLRPDGTVISIRKDSFAETVSEEYDNQGVLIRTTRDRSNSLKTAKSIAAEMFLYLCCVSSVCFLYYHYRTEEKWYRTVFG